MHLKHLQKISTVLKDAVLAAFNGFEMKALK